MVFLRLFHHQIREYWRESFLKHRLASLLITTILVLYFVGILTLGGIFFDDVIQNAIPGTDPLRLAARGLLPLGIGYAVLRMVLESGPGANLRPYLTLPFRRVSLVGMLAVLPLFSVWNAVPLAFVGAFCVDAASGGATIEALRFGLACLGVLSTVTYAAPVGRSVVSDRPYGALAVGGLVTLAVCTETVGIGSGLLAAFMNLSGWLLGGFVRGQALPVALASAALASIVATYVYWLREAIAVDKTRHSPLWSGKKTVLDRLTRRAPILREAVLELRLIFRNPRPRFIVLASFLPSLMIAALGGVGAGNWSALLKLPDPYIWLLGLSGTGTVVLAYGTNIFSWEGDAFEGMCVRPVAVKARMKTKLLILASSAVLCFLIPLPFLVLGGSIPLLLLQLAFLLYNVGVLCPVVVAGATFNRKAVDPNRRALGQTNYSGARTLIILPLFLLPLLPVLFFNELTLLFTTIAAAGCLSVLGMSFWLRGLTALHESNRYKMARGFRES